MDQQILLTNILSCNVCFIMVVKVCIKDGHGVEINDVIFLHLPVDRSVSCAHHSLQPQIVSGPLMLFLYVALLRMDIIIKQLLHKYIDLKK